MRQASHRCIKLQILGARASSPVDGPDAVTVSHVTIELVNLWAEFCRAYFLSCALRAKGPGGRVAHAQPSIRTPEDAITFAVHIATPRLRSNPGPFTRYNEPPWHDAALFRQIMAALSPSILPRVDAALSQPVRVLPDVVTFRNFFAHRNEETATKVRSLARNYRLPTNRHPVETLISYPPGRPDPLLVDFASEIRLLVEAF